MRISFVLLAGLLVIVAVVGVVAVVQPFDDGDDEPARVEVSVDAIVATPPQWYRAAVEVTARAVPLDPERFLLDGDERAIVVQPEPGALTGEVERGEQVTVAGVVYRLNRLQVDALRPLLRDEGRPVLARAPTDLGAPYISAQDVDALP